jgi:hypothetical protein
MSEDLKKYYAREKVWGNEVLQDIENTFYSLEGAMRHLEVTNGQDCKIYDENNNLVAPLPNNPTP